MKLTLKLTLLLALLIPAVSFGKDLPNAVNGVIDLRGNSFGQPVSLDGDWLIYWNQLLEPGTVARVRPQPVAFPKLWNKIELAGKQLPAQGYATYQLTILLQSPHPELSIEVPDMYTSYRLFVNGNEVAISGHPDSVAKNVTPFFGRKIVTLPVNADTINLLLQVANFSHSKGGPYKKIFLGQSNELTATRETYKAFDLVLVGCLFMGGLFFLGLYLFSRNDKSILYFSLFCIVYCYRMIGSDRYVLHELYPNLSWFVAIRLEYLSLTIGVALFSRYIHALYPKDSNRNIGIILETLCYFYSLIIIFFPPEVFTAYVNAFLVLMFVSIGFAFLIYLKAVRNRRVGSVFAIVSTAIVLAIFLINNLQYFGFVSRFKTVLFVGYILFFLCQSLILSSRFAYAFRKSAEQANLGLKAKADFLSTMSHEIRTPLNAVIGMAHVLKQSAPRVDQQKHIDVLMFSASNLLSIVNNILDYSKIESGKIIFETIEVDLRKMLFNISKGLEPLAKKKGLDIFLNISDNVPEKVVGDPTRISQVITNLVHNAVKFTDSGSVTISLSVVEQNRHTASLRFSIADTGIGIEAEKQMLIFEQFTQADSSTSRSHGGTGLGLTICKKILELQHVELKLRSEPGKGSEFYFVQSMPLAAVTLSTSEIENFENGTPLEGVQILLVEDNELNVLVAQLFLEKSGAAVEVARNGKEAIQKFNADKHHVILMDLQMPEMDGYEATRRLKPLAQDIPIIALTASLPAEVQTEVMDAGFDDILVKPIDPPELIQKLLALQLQER